MQPGLNVADVLGGVNRLLSLVPPASDELVGALVPSSAVSERGLAPRGFRMWQSNAGAAFSAAMRMRVRSHSGASDAGAFAAMTVAARLA